MNQQVIEQPKRLLTPAQVAERLGTTPGVLSVWRCTRRVVLPYIKIGRAVRYEPDAVEAFIEQNRRQ